MPLPELRGRALLWEGPTDLEGERVRVERVGGVLYVDLWEGQNHARMEGPFASEGDAAAALAGRFAGDLPKELREALRLE